MPSWLLIVFVACFVSGLDIVEEKCAHDGKLHYLPHETDCSAFYVCQDGKSFLQKCPTSLHFNPRNLACDYAKSAGCLEQKGGISSRFNKLDDRIKCPAENNPRFHTIMPHPTDCTQYFLCSNGIPYGKVCPSGLHFSYILQKCDYPEKAGCDSSPNEVPRPKSGRDHKVMECPSENGARPAHIPHLSDCEKFYTCDNGVPHLKNCQTGLHFNAKLQVCDYPDRAGCDKKEFSVIPEQQGPGIPSPFCPSVDRENQIFYLHPWNCSIYYLCAHGLAYEFACPARLHFSLEKKACDYEWLAKCQSDEDIDE